MSKINSRINVNSLLRVDSPIPSINCFELNLDSMYQEVNNEGN